MPGCSDHLVCDTATSRIRPYIAKEFRQQILSKTHNLSHPGVRATTKLVTSRFCWPGIRKDTSHFVQNCLQCQRAKIRRHTRSAPAKYEPPQQRFARINKDIFGPFPDMCADSVVKALLSQWISRFSVPAHITSDRGRQFESSVFAELMNTIGTTHLRTTLYHPQSNGIIERWHRTLKSAILCHNSERWVHHLPIILLGLRVYGSTLKIPGNFFNQVLPDY